jgi:Core-2/I-Branching enzyme
VKIAYLMVVHKHPRLLKRAIGTLSTEDSGFFIHIDRKANIGEFSGVRGEDIFFSEVRIPVYWGEFSQVEATMELVRQALACSANYDYFVFMQGSDYPLRSGRYIHRFLEENRGWEFMNLVKIPAPGYPLSKINKLRYPSAQPVRRFAARVLGKLGLAQRDYRRYLGGLEAYAGNAWWTLSRDACKYIMEFAGRNPQVERYFRDTFTSDEMFFQTILGNSPLRPRVRNNLVYVDATWSIRGEQRHMIEDKHVRFFEAQEKVWVKDEWGSREILFARKFSDDNLDLLGRIDEMIKRKEEHGATSLPKGNS